MDDPPRYPGDDDSNERGSARRKPRSVTVLAVVVAVALVVLVVVLHLTGTIGRGSH